MTEDSLNSYVRAALQIQGYAFSDAQVAEITAQFARIVAIADTILPAGASLTDAPEAGPAPVFRP
jgi:hypothetical protein